MDRAVSCTSPAPVRASLLPEPPRVASVRGPTRNQALADVVLHSLFNAPSRAHAALGADPPPGGMIAALYSRLVVAGDFSTLDADQDTLIQSLRESVALAGQPRYRLSNCGIGKALHVACVMWRSRSRSGLDVERLVQAVELCATLIRRQGGILLETCGVIMFHLGELITCEALSDTCAQLICECLEPKFRAEIRRQLHDPVTGAEVAFGLISTLRASEHGLTSEAGARMPRTAADALITTVHMLLDQQPALLMRSPSATLGLVARHGVLYLRQLAAVHGEHADAADKDRQYSAARLVKSCIDEVRSRTDGQAGAAQCHPPGFDPQLRYAPTYYAQWLVCQEPYVQAWLALRTGEAPAQQHSVHPETAAGPKADRPSLRDLDSPLSRLAQALGGLTDQDDPAAWQRREHAVACAEAAIAWVRSNAVHCHVSLQARAQVLLDIDSVFQHLDRANPLDAPRYDVTLEDLRAFMELQTAGLRDASGRTLLGPALQLPSGLRSWQRLLLTQLLA
ncbi:hypothetical protein [Stenotrophomonas sp.]|uniref:hypothetical protein n=1 Tax=Stenotrophomonas sp. TaxID=69392 RepID=UPI0028AAF9B7|nr:hypothetical protein [Stenotrophomonas sp.]